MYISLLCTVENWSSVISIRIYLYSYSDTETLLYHICIFLRSLRHSIKAIKAGFRTHSTGEYVTLPGALTIRPPDRDMIRQVISKIKVKVYLRLQFACTICILFEILIDSYLVIDYI